MRYTENQNMTVKTLIDTFFDLKQCRKVIDNRNGVLDFVFTNREFRIHIDDLDNVQSTLAIWKKLYTAKGELK